MQKNTVAFKKGLPHWLLNYRPVKLLLFMSLSYLLPAGCSHPVRNFIPGVYTAEWETEFSQARDTIVLEQQNGSDIWFITRRTYISLKNNEPRYKLVRWTGSYDKENKTILVNNNGRVLYFDPAKNEMKMGITVYIKL